MALGLLSVPAAARSQSVTGRVVESAGQAIRAAWVVLIDSTETEGSAVLTDSDGRFTLRAPRSGTWVVRASQLGYADRSTPPLVLSGGRATSVTLELQARALPLDALNVEVERRCDVQPEQGSAAAVLWEEAQKGLAAVHRTGRAAMVTYRTRLFERTLDLTGRRLTGSERTAISRGERPFTTPDPADLAKSGFVQQEDTTASFYAPDAVVLLSEAFASTHCFRARRGRGETSAMVGLEFQPVPGRDVPDIRGTLWIDTLTSALRYVEFRYTGINFGPRTNEMGGRIDFGRLPSGAWITENWLIRGPVVARPTAGDVRRLTGPPMVGFKEAGAELVEIIGQRQTPGTTARDTAAARAVASEPAVPGRTRLDDAIDRLSASVDDWTSTRDAPPEPTARTVAGRLRDGIDLLRGYGNHPNLQDQTRAVEAFRDAEQADNRAAVAWFGEGIAWAHGPALDIADATGYQHRRAHMETAAELAARRAFVRAIELDPSNSGPALELAALALATRKGSTIDTADAAIAHVLERAPPTADLLAAAALVAIADGAVERAVELGRHAIEAGGGSSADHALGSARLRAPGGEAEGAAAYMRGIDRLDADGALRYWDDARFMARPIDGIRWTEVSPPLRGVLLRELWERSAAENATTVGERLAVHMARLDTAHVTYRRQSLRGARPKEPLWTDTVPTDVPVDARGMIYVRHGSPDRVINTLRDRRGLIGQSVSWVYDRGNQPTVFHFMKVEGSADWSLTAGPQCDPLFYRTGEPGERALATLSGGRPADDAGVEFIAATDYMDPYERWYSDRMQVEPGLYGRAMRCLSIAGKLDEAIARGDEKALRSAISELDVEQRDWLSRTAELARSATRSLTTEEALPDFDRPLDVLTSLYTFRAEDGSTDVLAAVLIPGDGFTPEAADEGVKYPVRLSLILMDPPHERVFRTDTLMEYGASAPIAPGQYLRTAAQASTAPMDSMDFRLAIRNDGSSAEGRVQAGRIAVPDYSGTSVRVSDIVIADMSDGVLERGVVRLSPIPTHQIDVGSRFRLYYEVYNLEQGDPLSIRIRIRPAEGSGLLSGITRLFGGRKNEIDLRFEDVATTPGPNGLQYLREVGAELEPGRYIVTVTVRDTEAGGESTRETRLDVNSPPSG